MVDTMPTELAARSTAPKHFLALLGTLLVLTIAWVFATPLGAVPDEPAHMIRAAASARGEAVGVKPAGEEFGYPVVQVPDWVAESFHLPCEVGDASKTAECVPSVGDDTTLTPSSSSSASNSPVFYTVIGLPSLFITGDAGLYAMRIMSAILTSLLLAAMILDEGKRRVVEVIDQARGRGMTDLTKVEKQIVEALSRFFTERTRRKPIQLVVFQHPAAPATTASG